MISRTAQLSAASLLIVGVVTAVVLLRPPAPVASPAVVAPPAKAPEPAQPAAPAVVTADQPAPVAKPPAAAAVTYPDGSTAPLLNGVDQPVKLIWNDRPYSPIRSKVMSQGIEWYVHEDGSHSTVQWIDINGVRSAVGLVASPHDTLPTADQLHDQLRRQGQAPR